MVQRKKERCILLIILSTVPKGTHLLPFTKLLDGTKHALSSSRYMYTLLILGASVDLTPMLSGACQTIGVASVTNMTRKSRSTTLSLFQCCVRRWMPNIFAPLYDCTCSLSSRVHPTSMVQSYNSVMVNVCVSIESMPSILSAAAKNGSSPGTASSPGNESAANWMMNFQSKHPPQTIL